MSNPFVNYRIDSINDLKRNLPGSATELDWHADLTIIREFYARFNHQIDPDELEQYVGNPLAITHDGKIISFAIPLSFREGETEIGGVATVPDRQNKGYCKSLISEMAFRILDQGKAATLTTEKTNLFMQQAFEKLKSGFQSGRHVFPAHRIRLDRHRMIAVRRILIFLVQ